MFPDGKERIIRIEKQVVREEIFMYIQEKLLFASGGRSNFRIPSIVADRHGNVYAFCNDRKDGLDDHAQEVALVCARKPYQKDWEPVQTIDAVEGWACSMGSAVYDAVTDTVMCSVTRIPTTRDEFKAFTKEEVQAIEAEAQKKAQELGVQKGPILLSTQDQGKSWQSRTLDIIPTEYVHWDGTKAMIQGSCHGSAHGIQLKNGPHKGRLLCPSRIQIGEYSDWEGLMKCVYNNAIYSDDHGMTWKASTPVQLATGEGTLIEDNKGVILYNSRAYFEDQKRYLATSTDGGETFGDFRTDDFLLEEKRIGCNASFLRVERAALKNAARLLPPEADSITLFANPRSQKRENMTVCYSFDSGKTWAGTKCIYEGACAYSSLDFNEADQTFYLLYEKGISSPYEHGIAAAEFDLEWLL